MRVHFFIPLFFLIILVSCSESQNNIVETSQPDTQLLKPNAYYAATNGKVLGYWAHYSNFSVDFFREIKNKYGFNLIRVYDDEFSGIDRYNNAQAAGYSNSNIFWHLKPAYLYGSNTFSDVIDSYSALGITNFYVDEPLESTDPDAHITLAELSSIAQYLQNNYSNAILWIGSRIEAKWITPTVSTTNPLALDYWNILMSFNNVRMMNDSYWLNASSQSQYWQDYYDFYYINWERRSISHFINDDQDFDINGTEFNALINKANSLQLNQLWFYNADTNLRLRLNIFCDALVDKGWMVKYNTPPVSGW